MGQGCFISFIIFAMLMEALAQRIRTHPEIKDIQLGTQNPKIDLFADDVVLTVSNSATSSYAVQQLLQLFGDITYYKVNESKSQILQLNISSLQEKLCCVNIHTPGSQLA